MPDTRTVTLPDGRNAAFIDYGPADGSPVLWCHGGPGSRLEPEAVASAAAAEGFRLIGIDRPGYGRSTPKPGRKIADWVPEGLAVADALGIRRCAAVGVSTGGAYALALAALAPDRISAVVACCALTDTRWPEGRALMTAPLTAGIWSAADRDAALAIATREFGADGSKMFSQTSGSPELPQADLDLLQDPAWTAGMAQAMGQMFAFGVQGYTDDRIADGVGWRSFDVGAVRCPVVVLHGDADNIVPVAHARHTAAIVPGATLRLMPALGHLSISGQVPAVLKSLKLDR